MGLIDLGHEADPVLTRVVEEDKVKWWRKRNLRLLYLLLYPTCMGIEITSGFDSQMINGLQFIPAWNKYFGTSSLVKGKLVWNVTGSLLGIINASYNLGAILAVPVVPWVAQKVGRRWSIFIGSGFQCVGAVLQAFSQNTAMYIIARMTLGFGIVFCIVSGSAMLGELSYPKERPIMTSMFNASWFVGSLIAAGIVVKTANIHGDWSWRLPSILQACPSLVQMALVFFLPESPRYLISKDRREEAFDILVHYHAEGDRESVFVKAEMVQIETTIKIELEASKLTWMDMIRTPGMRRRTFIAAAMGLYTQWSGNTLISFYLGKILVMIGYTDTYTKTMINLGNTAWSFINGTIIAIISPRFKRRTMFLIGAIGMLCVYISWITAVRYSVAALDAGTTNKAAGIAVLFFIYSYSPWYNIGNNALAYTYMVEIFPYAERSRGISIEQFFVRGAGFFTTYINPIGMDGAGWKFLFMYIAMICCEILTIYFFYPETQGRTLEELAFLFEDESFADKATMAVEKEMHQGGDGMGEHVEVVEKRPVAGEEIGEKRSV
ncbi:MFS sugar transporter-like protein [Hyaloscypha variabilis F]|uniref:MFS sugar transporter-like protein n=1 Tax=Hyaloscypha variabilis (strain UAMH 11265 / GT02V1 / F) TaxID=1149755 RepID=A0A2J6RCQ2_HYAVF|nr:MFS sugar transporter-like protein [Hyaloscypha variabilis F]